MILEGEAEKTSGTACSYSLSAALTMSRTTLQKGDNGHKEGRECTKPNIEAFVSDEAYLRYEIRCTCVAQPTRLPHAHNFFFCECLSSINFRM